MNIRRISVIALSNRDFESFDAKLDEACRWVALAARGGSQLAVLPEAMNLYRGDGPGNPLALRIDDVALDDWQSACGKLIQCAVDNRIAVAIPVFIREHGAIKNVFQLVSEAGEVLGRYVKTFPTTWEIEEGVLPARGNKLIPWQGLRIGGAICFDMNFPEVFDSQFAAGADMFLIPTMFEGGIQMNYHALRLQRPVAIAYPAWSRIIDIMGREVAGGGYRHETLRFGFGVPIYTADINFDRGVFYPGPGQNCIADLLARYGGKVRVELEQGTAAFAVESLCDSVTVKDIAAEYGLETPRQHCEKARPIIEAKRNG